MKKIVFIIILSLFFIALASQPCIASETDDIVNSTPNEITDYLPSGSSAEDIVKSADASYVVSLFSKLIKSAFSKVSEMLVYIVGCIFISSIINLIFETIGKKGSEICRFISAVFIITTVYSLVCGVFDSVTQYLEKLSGFISALALSMGAIYISGGNASAALSNSSGIAALLIVVEKICIKYLIPLLKICFALGIASSISGIRLNKFSSMIKKGFISVTVLLMTVITITLAFQNSISSSADSVAVRSLRFAALKSIPIVGGGIGEALRTVSAGLQLTKSITSAYGVIVILVLALIPLSELFSLKISLSLSEAISSLISVNGQDGILSEAISLIDFLIALVAIVSLVFLIVISLFMSTSSAIYY